MWAPTLGGTTPEVTATESRVRLNRHEHDNRGTVGSSVFYAVRAEIV
jgi:hypothetical protein